MSLNIPLTLKTTVVGTNISDWNITKELSVITKKEMTLELQSTTGEVSIDYVGVSNPALIMLQSENDFSVKFTMISGTTVFPCKNGIPCILPIDSNFTSTVSGTSIYTTNANLISVQCGIYGI